MKIPSDVLGLIRHIHGVTPSHEGECTTQSPPPGGAKCRVDVYLLGHMGPLKKAKNKLKLEYTNTCAVCCFCDNTRDDV